MTSNVAFKQPQATQKGFVKQYHVPPLGQH